MTRGKLSESLCQRKLRPEQELHENCTDGEATDVCGNCMSAHGAISHVHGTNHAHVYIVFQLQQLCLGVLVHSLLPCFLHMFSLVLSRVWWSICTFTFQTKWHNSCSSKNRWVWLKQNQIKHCWQVCLGCNTQHLPWAILEANLWSSAIFTLGKWHWYHSEPGHTRNCWFLMKSWTFKNLSV